MSVGLLFDSTQCIGCGACAAACKEANSLPQEVEPRLTAYTWTVVEEHDGAYSRRLCMHCLEPTCVSVCPVAALQRSPQGAVTYDAARCIGCRYCMLACPFEVPRYEWDRAVPVVGKCTLCPDRLAAGQPPACAEACPTGATLFGTRDALLQTARARVEADPDAYAGGIYGVNEAGGTGVLMLAKRSFAQLGLPSTLPRQPLPLLTWQVLSKVPDFVILAGAGLMGLKWITDRRDEVKAQAAASAATAPASPWERIGRTWRRLTRVTL
jgi:formate dehydrogenase iron-sulfur subunit